MTYKMQMSVEVADRDDLLEVLEWLIDHLTEEQWDEYVSSRPHSSTLFPAEKFCECHGKVHKPKPVGKVFIAPADALMFQAPKQVGGLK